jgi:hypothetical protein
MPLNNEQTPKERRTRVRNRSHLGKALTGGGEEKEEVEVNMADVLSAQE